MYLANILSCFRKFHGAWFMSSNLGITNCNSWQSWSHLTYFWKQFQREKLVIIWKWKTKASISLPIGLKPTFPIFRDRSLNHLEGDSQISFTVFSSTLLDVTMFEEYTKTENCKSKKMFFSVRPRLIFGMSQQFVIWAQKASWALQDFTILRWVTGDLKFTQNHWTFRIKLACKKDYESLVLNQNYKFPYF